MTNIDFFFDFFSPYAYLAHQRLPELADEMGCTITYKPINLLEAKVAAGNTGPQNREIPAKIQYLLTDIRRWAAEYGVPFELPKDMALESALANKATFFAIDRARAREYVQLVWQGSYGAGVSMGREEVLRGVAEQLGWPGDELVAFARSEEAERRYADVNAEAHKRGVFGVPIMMIGDEMWWGNDRLDMLRGRLGAMAPQRRAAAAAD